MANNDDDQGAAESKLIPEWSVSADDQVILAGLAVVAALAILLGWNAWRGGEDGEEVTPAVLTEEVAAGATEPDAGGPVGAVSATPTTETEAQQEDSEEEEAAVTTTTAPADPSTTEAVATPVIGDVQAAVDPFFGAITGTNQGSIAVLTGFVANEAESREAEGAAAEVDGITDVDNQLVILEPLVLDEIRGAGVTEAGVAGEGTVMTVRGTIANQADRGPAVAAAAAVDGVSDVIDELKLSVSIDLNQLPQVQFANASAEILPASFADLDAAAELLMAADGANFEVQGYTDVTGDDARNQRLSEERADAVRTYLIGKGVDGDSLSAAGFGETEEFGPDFVDNRVVRFEQVDR